MHRQHFFFFNKKNHQMPQLYDTSVRATGLPVWPLDALPPYLSVSAPDSGLNHHFHYFTKLKVRQVKLVGTALKTFDDDMIRLQ